MKKMYYLLIIVGLILLVTGIVGLSKSTKTSVDNHVTNKNTGTSKNYANIESGEKQQDDDIQESAEEKGRKFECYTIDKFDRRQYKVLEWAGDKVSENHSAERSKYPDFLIEDKQSGIQFLMECKYRSRWTTNSNGEETILWVKQRKIDDYTYYGELKHADVVVVFGVGGQPDSPEEVFALPLHYLSKPLPQRHEFLNNYKVDISKPFLFLPNKHNLAIMKSLSNTQ